MRKSTRAVQRELATAEAADDTLANRLTALLGFLDSTDRARLGRNDALRGATAEDQVSFLAEIKAMKQEFAFAVWELRGTPLDARKRREG